MSLAYSYLQHWVDDEEDVQLPIDILMEILTRVSLSTLDTCRNMSFFFNRATYTFEFMLDRCQRLFGTFGLFTQQFAINFPAEFVPVHNTLVMQDLTLGYMPEAVHILSSSLNGSLLCSNNNLQYPRFYICRPTSKEWVKLPNPRTRYHSKGFALTVHGSSPHHYKILRLCWSNMPRSNLVCELFDSVLWKWRWCGETCLNVTHSLGLEGPISFGGYLYWMVNHSKIFVFDLYTFNSYFKMLPNRARYCSIYPYKNELASRDGGLDLLHTCLHIMDIWNLPAHNSAWVFVARVHLSHLLGSDIFYSTTIFRTYDKMFVVTVDGIYMMDIYSRNVEILSSSDDHPLGTEVYIYHSAFSDERIVWNERTPSGYNGNWVIQDNHIHLQG